MVKNVAEIERRSLPPGLITAYPRKQQDCPDPARGLASVEALFAAYTLMGRDTSGLLDNYYWKEDFLKKNSSYLGRVPNS
jgi:pre-rRNA-processing protein TSR3